MTVVEELADESDDVEDIDADLMWLHNLLRTFRYFVPQMPNPFQPIEAAKPAHYALPN
jgi:hypothetical protein